ncbi:MAG: M23 family metallopeptidase [Clostridia bacterium]|nr:M23 family metallopeptidase [Clostridia bacterium]
MNTENEDKTNPEEPEQEPEPEIKPYKNPKLYISLAVCIGAVSIAGWSTYRNIKDVFTTSGTKSSKNISSTTQKKSTKNNNTKNTNTQSNSKTSILDESSQDKKVLVPYENPDNIFDSQETQAVINQNISEKNNIIYPVGKEIIKEFSNEKPVYSKTLGDWRAHQGTDFKSEVGSDVKAITSGTVTDIYEDLLYGTTVVILHDPHFTAYYSGLDKNVCVKKGQKVESDEKIGLIDRVPCESQDEPHLHLSINKDGEFIDPVLVLENN